MTPQKLAVVLGFAFDVMMLAAVVSLAMTHALGNSELTFLLGTLAGAHAATRRGSRTTDTYAPPGSSMPPPSMGGVAPVIIPTMPPPKAQAMAFGAWRAEI